MLYRLIELECDNYHTMKVGRVSRYLATPKHKVSCLITKR